jgi:hypothetical protein
VGGYGLGVAWDGRAMIRTAMMCVEGYPMLIYVLVAILSVIWLIMIGLGHRRYWALTWPGVIMVICVVRAWLEVRRGPPWSRD